MRTSCFFSQNLEVFADPRLDLIIDDAKARLEGCFHSDCHAQITFNSQLKFTVGPVPR